MRNTDNAVVLVHHLFMFLHRLGDAWSCLHNLSRLSTCDGHLNLSNILLATFLYVLLKDVVSSALYFVSLCFEGTKASNEISHPDYFELVSNSVKGPNVGHIVL
jgi:hypothetical protein